MDSDIKLVGNVNADVDQTDGIIPPIIINQYGDYSSIENQPIVFQTNNSNDEEPELILSTDTLPSAPPPYTSIDPSENTLQTPQTVKQTIPQRTIAFIILCVTNLTLEPAEFMQSLAGGIAGASYNQLTMDKACYELGNNKTICDNVTAYDDIYDDVNDKVILKLYKTFIIKRYYFNKYLS